ncbi:uncharacterized protein [Misgurnus anguillicaudatus]|uniref:uncharacterized protein n=1 Tax=Misgurnus anguillicaudatus TaxID=75329 RepID=UPI003CCF20EE
MMCIKGLDYSYNTTLKVTESDKVVPIRDVLKIENEFQRVNVKVQIIHIESQGYNFIQDQRFFPNTTYRVADNTGQIDFTNWGEKTLNIGSWYILSSVSVRHFKGNLIITSTRDSTLLEEDPDPDMILTTQHTTTSTNVTTEIIGATINVHHICPQHHKITNMPMSVSRVHCPKCNTHYKVTSITMYSYGNLTFKTSSEIQTATIENQLINSIIDLPPHPSADTIIDLLLELPPVNITIHNGRITRISQASASQASATQASATQASATQASATQASATQASATQASATQASATQASATQASATQASATQASATQASATQASATQASATQASATQASATLFPTDLDLDQFMTDDFFDESASTLPPTIPPTKAPNPTKRKPPQLKKD